MGGFRIKPIVVAILGSILCIAAVVLIAVLLIQPLQVRQQTAQATLDANAADATPQAQNAAKAAKDKATADADLIRAHWKQTEDAIMPQFDVSQRYKAWGQLARELSYNLGPSIASYVPSTGVTLLTPISIQAPPNNPNAINGAPLIIPIAGGSLSVGGPFRSLLKHVVKWNSFNRLVLIDNLSLTGNSPYMTAHYDAEVIIFPQNDTSVGQPISTAGAGETAGGFAAGGPPGGNTYGRPMGIPPGG